MLWEAGRKEGEAYWKGREGHGEGKEGWKMFLSLPDRQEGRLEEDGGVENYLITCLLPTTHRPFTGKTTTTT